MHNIVCVCVCWNVSNVKVKCQIFTLQKCIEAFFYFQLLYLNSFQYSSSQLRSTKTCKWSQKQHQMLACRNFIRLNRSPFCVFSFGAVLTWLQNICRFKRMPCAFDSSKDWIDHFFSKKKNEEKNKFKLWKIIIKEKVLGCAMYRNLFTFMCIAFEIWLAFEFSYFVL